MNDPSTTIIDIEEQRGWLRGYREQTGASWSELSKRTGIPQGTVSQFAGERGYAGDEQRVADQVYRFRQLLASQASIDVTAPERPGFFETKTSEQLTNMLAWAQRGKIVVAALGPGLGKTETARQYRQCYPNVFMATMRPSTAGVNNMQVEVLEAMGDKNASGTPQRLSRRICDRVDNLASPLIIIDEAQHLSEKALEEVRSWNDATGVGIALFGNAGVLHRLEGGNRREAFAQLYSRVDMRVQRAQPIPGDVEALADAWMVHDAAILACLQRICMTPGGLRNGTKAMELGSMIAASEGKPLIAGHLQDAWAQLSSRSVL